MWVPGSSSHAEAQAFQPSFFDTHNLAEITHPDYPGERLVACKNPVLGAERARKREELLIIRTSLAAAILPAAEVVSAYKGLAQVEQAFRSLKTVDLEVRPVHHRPAYRVRAHLLICMLAYYLIWHLRRAWAPLTSTDENPPTRTDPVAKAQRSQAATSKARTGRTADGLPAHSFSETLEILGELPRNLVGWPGQLWLRSSPPPLRPSFELLGISVPRRCV